MFSVYGDSPPPSHVEVKNEWSFTSSLPPRLYDVDRENFPFLSSLLIALILVLTKIDAVVTQLKI
jgi:hypothetical protein